MVQPLPGRSGCQEIDCVLDGSTAARRRLERIDRLVLAAWTLDKDPQGLGVVQIDGDLTNNCVHNLRWATASEHRLNRAPPTVSTRGGSRVRGNKVAVSAG